MRFCVTGYVLKVRIISYNDNFGKWFPNTETFNGVVLMTGGHKVSELKIFEVDIGGVGLRT